ncbi:DUF721 family protein [Tomitella gaofuii]|uniref:DUF721 family protein n=1 Tax=Tomitella gaofuii TaxID=2760083 RepID=UPI0015FD981D|nr:DUF721 family protein [Tomitella gaofuii]
MAAEPGEGGDAPAGGGDGAPRGADLARRALEEARARAAAQGKSVGKGMASPQRRQQRRPSRRRWSGPADDPRDPQTLGTLAASLARRRGWNRHVAEGRVLGCWDEVVGEEIADHAAPSSLHDGVLHVTAESTAWATQLRMVQSQILAKIARAVGDGVVTKLEIRGPSAPSWRHGPRHVSGRGPRDTYG